MPKYLYLVVKDGEPQYILAVVFPSKTGADIISKTHEGQLLSLPVVWDDGKEELWVSKEIKDLGSF